MNRKILFTIVAIFVLLASAATGARADYVGKVWEKNYALRQFTTPFALKTDSRGNVYVTGAAYDNSTGTTVKYDADGNQKWAPGAPARAAADADRENTAQFVDGQRIPPVVGIIARTRFL